MLTKQAGNMQTAARISKGTSLSCDRCALGASGDCPAANPFQGLQLQRVSAKQVPAGAEIFPGNETPSTVAIIQSGWAIQYARLLGGERQILTFLIPGDVFDQDAVILPQTPNLFAFKALTEAAVCHFAIEDYRQLFQADVRSRRFAKRQLRRHQALMAKHVIDIGRRRALGRLAGFLLELRQRLTERNLMHDELMPFPLRQEDVADALGLTHAHVNRTLKHLRDSGAIQTLPGILRILDPAALAALAPGEALLV